MASCPFLRQPLSTHVKPSCISFSISLYVFCCTRSLSSDFRPHSHAAAVSLSPCLQSIRYSVTTMSSSLPFFFPRRRKGQSLVLPKVKVCPTRDQFVYMRNTHLLFSCGFRFRLHQQTVLWVVQLIPLILAALPARSLLRALCRYSLYPTRGPT